MRNADVRERGRRRRCERSCIAKRTAACTFTTSRDNRTTGVSGRARSVGPNDVVRTDVPGWRIVSDDLWDAAHRRLQAAAEIYLRGTKGQVWGRPPSELASKYLLSGKLRCACCGASMTVRSRSHGGRRFYYYICSSFDSEGKSVCSNSFLLPLTGADEEIIGKMSSLLDADVVQGAIEDAVEMLRAGQDGQGARRDALRHEIEVNVTEQARLVEAVASGSDIPALAAALKARELRRAQLQRELDAVDARERLTAFDSAATARELRRRVDEWHGLVRRNTPIARQVLDRLLADRITWTPRRDDGIYEYAGRLQFDRLLTGIVRTEDRRKPKVSRLTDPYGRYGVPNGIRTRVLALKGPRPGPLDDGDIQRASRSFR